MRRVLQTLTCAFCRSLGFKCRPKRQSNGVSKFMRISDCSVGAKSIEQLTSAAMPPWKGLSSLKSHFLFHKNLWSNLNQEKFVTYLVSLEPLHNYGPVIHTAMVFLVNFLKINLPSNINFWIKKPKRA
jgi:hypothetical protein